jgi:hypothetical protein
MAISIERRLMQGPKLPDITSATFFKVRRKKTRFLYRREIIQKQNISECFLGISICYFT